MTKTSKTIAWALAGAGFLAGTVGVVLRITQGHHMANYGSYIPWGLWVAAYIYLIGLSAGAFLLSTLVYVFRVKRLEGVGKLALFTALITLFGAMLLVWFDLGHPLRAYRLITHTHFTSMMGWMAWLYTSYFVLLLVELWFAIRADLAACANDPGLRGKLCGFLTFGRRDQSTESIERDHRILKILGSIGVPLAVAFHGGVGALFGVVGARPFWHGGLTPIVFLVGALVSGGALLTFLTVLWGPDRGSRAHRNTVIFLGQIVLGLLALDVLLEWAEYSTGLISAVPSMTESIRLVMFGPYWWAFWIVHVILGVIVPAALLTFRGRSKAAIGWAGALIASTFLTVRLNIVLPGLDVEELAGLKHAFTGPGLTFNYYPSLGEWLVFVWVVSLAGILFLTGYQLLPIIRQKEVVRHGR
ncbi:MAG: polysulfide reductase NrfD [Actinobacteria bacterium]|nr:polysulfide reductase NrfD [Actinomycetota bacterium]